MTKAARLHQTLDAVMDAVWQEGKHPRAKSGNTGQFAPKMKAAAPAARPGAQAAGVPVRGRHTIARSAARRAHIKIKANREAAKAGAAKPNPTRMGLPRPQKGRLTLPGQEPLPFGKPAKEPTRLAKLKRALGEFQRPGITKPPASSATGKPWPGVTGAARIGVDPQGLEKAGLLEPHVPGPRTKRKSAARRAWIKIREKRLGRGAVVGQRQASPQPAETGVGKSHVMIERKLSSSPVKGMKHLGGGINDTRIIDFGDGSKAVFKPDPGKRARAFQTESELGAWLVAKRAGMTDLVAPVVIRTIQGGLVDPKSGQVYGKAHGAVMDFMPGNMAAATPRDQRRDGVRDCARAAMFDFVIGNSDRHEGNWLVDGEQLHLIDHGYSFPPYIQHHGQQYLVVRPDELERAPNFQSVAEHYIANRDSILADLKKAGLPDISISGVAARIDELPNLNWSTLR